MRLSVNIGRLFEKSNKLKIGFVNKSSWLILGHLKKNIVFCKVNPNINKHMNTNINTTNDDPLLKLSHSTNVQHKVVPLVFETKHEVDQRLHIEDQIVYIDQMRKFSFRCWIGFFFGSIIVPIISPFSACGLFCYIGCIIGGRHMKTQHKDWNFRKENDMIMISPDELDKIKKIIPDISPNSSFYFPHNEWSLFNKENISDNIFEIIEDDNNKDNKDNDKDKIIYDVADTNLLVIIK